MNLLHIPYTVWHLSYVVLGAAVAPELHPERLLGTLLAFFLALGIACHCLDEYNERPLGTMIPGRVLVGLAAVSLGAAVLMGTVAALAITVWVLPFVAFGAFVAVAYNLGLWRGRFHSNFWFALAWGAFPALTSYWANALSLSAAAILMAFGCFILSLVQRHLSTHVRTIRRKVVRIEGRMEMADGNIRELDPSVLLNAPETALKLLSVTVPILATGVLVSRL